MAPDFCLRCGRALPELSPEQEIDLVHALAVFLHAGEDGQRQILRRVHGRKRPAVNRFKKPK